VADICSDGRLGKSPDLSHLISEGPDTLEHLDSFSIITILNHVRREAPDLLRLFQTLGNSSRNLSDDGLAVEQLKGLVSLCTLLNTRSNRAKGMQLLIAIMLVQPASRQWLFLIMLEFGSHTK
jgi:hypothetical protein